MEGRLKEIQKKLKEDIKDSIKFNEDGNYADWGCEVGILLTRGQASVLLELVDRSLRVKTDDKLLNQTIILEWLRQWTKLYDKGKEGTFKKILQEFVFEYMTDEFE